MTLPSLFVSHGAPTLPLTDAPARDFLVELGTEELPPLALPELERSFAEGLRTAFTEAALKHGEIRSFATPRRLAVLVRDLRQLLDLANAIDGAAFGRLRE